MFGLESELSTKTRDLSHGRRRIVSLARALVTRPVLLILDEPAAGLDTHETEALAYSLRQIVADGVTVALVDHDMSLVMGNVTWSRCWNSVPSSLRTSKRDRCQRGCPKGVPGW